MNFLLDAAPPLGTVGIAAGAIFFLVLAAAAFIVFRMLKRTVKMALRIAILLIIVAIGFAGCVAFWALGGSVGGTPPRPSPTRSK